MGLVIAAAPVLFLCFGFPAYLFVSLYSNRKQLTSQNVLEKFSFFYKDYSDRTPYWEVLIYMRKAAIAAIAVLGEMLNVQIQGYLAIFVLFVSLLLQSQMNPYTNLELNQLEAMSIGISISLFIATGIVQNMEDNPVSKATLAWLCFGIIIGYVLYITRIITPAIVQLIKQWWESSGIESMRRISEKLKGLFWSEQGKAQGNKQLSTVVSGAEFDPCEGEKPSHMHNNLIVFLNGAARKN